MFSNARGAVEWCFSKAADYIFLFSFKLDYQFKSSFSHHPFQNSLGSFSLEEDRGAVSCTGGDADVRLPTPAASVAPHHQIIAIFFFESEAVFFLKLSFPKTTKGEGLISAVMIMARMEGEPVYVPMSVQS